LGVRGWRMRARVVQTPACDGSDAVSITVTPPVPARRSAKAKAVPPRPPPTMAAPWSMPASAFASGWRQAAMWWPAG
jgi:hypothetical protein